MKQYQLQTLLSFFIRHNSRIDNLGDDKMFVANYEVSPDRTTIVMTSLNMLKNLKCEDLVLAIDSACKIPFNRYLVYVMGRIDKQQMF